MSSADDILFAPIPTEECSDPDLTYLLTSRRVTRDDLVKVAKRYNCRRHGFDYCYWNVSFECVRQGKCCPP
jgi:hypothetical protein